MIGVSVLDSKGQKVGEIGLKEEIFAAPPNEATVHRAVVRVLAGRRRGTVATKTRGEVAGSGRKPWRQKGTGRARAGSLRSPIWRGGGTVFGPQPRSYSFSLPTKIRRLALRTALSAKVAAGQLIVVDSFGVAQGKTREIVATLRALDALPKALIVTAGPDAALARASRNLPGIKVSTVTGLNPYEVLAHDKVVISREVVAKLEEVLS